MIVIKIAKVLVNQKQNLRLHKQFDRRSKLYR